jgi:tetratricopeptide (TPR) repeat protein
MTSNNRSLILENFLNKVELDKAIWVFSIIGLIVYANSLGGEFLWDDIAQIIASNLTNSVGNLPSIFKTGQANIFYRPVFLSWLTIIRSISGDGVFLFHFSQLFLHITNTVLIFLIFKRFLGDKTSFLLSLVFLVHPMNVEAVAYISAVSDPLFVFFGLSSFLLMVRQNIGLLRFSSAVILILLSVLTKEVGLTILLMIIIYRFIFVKRNRENVILSALFAFVPLIFYALLRFGIAKVYFSKVHYAAIAQLPFSQRLISVPKIAYFYLATFLAPINLSVAQHWVVRSINLYDFVLPLLFDLLFLAIIFYSVYTLAKDNRATLVQLIFFSLWFLIGMSPFLQIIPLDMTVAERWFYFPMIGLLGIVGILLRSITVKGTINSRTITGLTVVIVLVFSARSVVRNINWSDAYSLFKHDINISKNSFDVENNYGYQLLEKGQLEEAIAHFKRSIELSPEFSGSYVNAGIAYMQKGNHNNAEVHLLKALEKDGGNYYAFNALIYNYLLMHEYKPAKGWAEYSLQTYANDPQFLLFLALAEDYLGNHEIALEYARKSYSLYPTRQSANILNQLLSNQKIIFE